MPSLGQDDPAYGIVCLLAQLCWDDSRTQQSARLGRNIEGQTDARRGTHAGSGASFDRPELLSTDTQFAENGSHCARGKIFAAPVRDGSHQPRLRIIPHSIAAFRLTQFAISQPAQPPCAIAISHQAPTSASIVCGPEDPLRPRAAFGSLNGSEWSRHRGRMSGGDWTSRRCALKGGLGRHRAAGCGTPGHRTGSCAAGLDPRDRQRGATVDNLDGGAQTGRPPSRDCTGLRQAIN